MNPKRITDPSDPVTIAELKANSRVDGTSEDTLIGKKISSATSYCEHKIQRQFVTATYKLTLDRFPSSRSIKLPMPPLQSVTSIQYYDSDGTQQTLDSSNYIVDTFSEPGKICLSPSGSWASTQSRANAVEITYVAGFGSEDDVPNSIKDAILMTASHLYENREATTSMSLKEVPIAVESLLERYKWGGYH